MNSVLYLGAVCWNGNIKNQDRIRLDTFIKIERVMDHAQSTEDFWQMTPGHKDINLTDDELTRVTDTELYALESHSYYCTVLA